MSDYLPRSLKEWMALVKENKLALPEFQRSYVWDDEKTTKLIHSLIKAQPVGVLLLMEATHPSEAMFKNRPILGQDTSGTGVVELVLDGQQRLTSLWRAFDHGRYMKYMKNAEAYGGESRYFLRFSSSDGNRLIFEDVIAKKIREKLSAPEAYLKGLIPIDVLGFNDVTQDPGTLFAWCQEACALTELEPGKLQDNVMDMIDKLHNARLFFAKLPETIDRQECIEIFITVNQSAVKVSEFDIAVAGVSIPGSSSPLRNRIGEWIKARPQRELEQQYLPENEEKAIEYIGELMFKVACLRQGLVPTIGKYSESKVLEDVGTCFDEITNGISFVYELLDGERVWSRDLMPSEIPLRVVPALYPDVERLSADAKGRVRSALKQYVWQAFLSDRYEREANQRLKNDFDKLRNEVIPAVAQGQPRSVELDGNLPGIKDMSNLHGPLAGAGARSALLRSFLVMSLHGDAIDFASGEKINRDSVSSRQRHHLFPKKFLVSALESECDYPTIRAVTNHVFNYALVDGSTNQALGYGSPKEYLDRRYAKNRHLSTSELKARVESHIIPFKNLYVGEDAKLSEYEKFIRERAKLFCAKVQRLTGRVE